MIAERYGGPQHNVREVCAALAARGHRVVVLTTDRDGSQRLSECDRHSLGDEHPWVVMPVPTRGPALTPAFVRRAGELMADADVVHLHGIYSPATAMAGIVADRKRVPYVQQLHGAATDYHWRQKRWKKAPYEALIQRRVISRAAAVIAMTEMEADQGSRVFPSARMRIVPPPVVDEPASAERSRRGGGAEGASPTIGFLGRLSEKKGAPILLEAFSRIAQEFPDLRLVVAGPDDEGIGTRMKQEVDRLGLEGRVSFPGMVVGAEKAALLEEFDMFALPSADESFGIAVVEAMDEGLPVVITENVAIAGDVRSAGAGLIAPRSAAGFADAMAELLRNPSDAAGMGEAGRKLAVERFSRAASTAELERLYEEVTRPGRDQARSGCRGRRSA
jgi:glycosyltransferase involved in cell wall biosynthesis